MNKLCNRNSGKPRTDCWAIRTTCSDIQRYHGSILVATGVPVVLGSVQSRSWKKFQSPDLTPADLVKMMIITLCSHITRSDEHLPQHDPFSDTSNSSQLSITSLNLIKDKSR